MARFPVFKESDDPHRWNIEMQSALEDLLVECGAILAQSETAEAAVPRFEAILAECNGPEETDQLLVRAEQGAIVFENNNSGDHRRLVRRSNGIWWLDDGGEPPADDPHEQAMADALWLIWWGSNESIAQVAGLFLTDQKA